MSKAQLYREVLGILGNELRDEIDKMRFVGATVLGNAELDGLMLGCPKGAVSNGLRSLVEDLTQADDRVYDAITEKLEQAREGEAEAKE